MKAEYAYQGMPVPDKGPPLLFMNGDVFDLLSESDDHWWEVRALEFSFRYSLIMRHVFNREGKTAKRASSPRIT